MQNEICKDLTHIVCVKVKKVKIVEQTRVKVGPGPWSRSRLISAPGLSPSLGFVIFLVPAFVPVKNCGGAGGISGLFAVLQSACRGKH